MKRSAFITGAGGGLGHAAVERLLMKGWRVFAADIDPLLLRSSTHDPDVVPISLDVTDPESIESAFEAVSSHTDRLEAIVNFAGVMGVGSLTDIPEERIARILDVNVLGTYRVNKAFLPLVRACRGRIVNISSETGWQTAAPFNGPYAMSKHAIEAYSDALRRELGLLGVQVIKIQPGPFKTNMVEGIAIAFDQAQSETATFAKVIDRLKKHAARAAGSAHHPDILAQVVERALTAKRPKSTYSVRPDRLRSSLERLPLRAADHIWLSILRRANKP